MKNIIVLGGGGAKGQLQITVLKELYLNGRLRDPDLYAGSSVGAINAAALSSATIDCQSLYSVYSEILKQVFDRAKLFPPIYSTKNFDNIWYQIIKIRRFGDLPVKTLISTIDFCKKDPHFFKSWEEEDKNLLLIDVVKRSFAAPYYFGRISDPVKRRVYGDGGMGFHNLPIIPAFLETIRLGWFPAEELNFTIIGTGFQDFEESYETASREKTVAQIFDYLTPSEGGLARMMSRAEQISTIKFLTKYFNIHAKYYDIKIPEKIDKMDKIRAIPDYIKYGVEAAKKPLIEI